MIKSIKGIVHSDPREDALFLPRYDLNVSLWEHELKLHRYIYPNVI